MRLAERLTIEGVTPDYIYFVIERTVYKLFVVSITKSGRAADPFKNCHFPTRPSRAREVDLAPPIQACAETTFSLKIQEPTAGGSS